MMMIMMKGFFATPLRFVCEIVGKRRVLLKESQNIFKLGKQCMQCHRPIVHRQSISVCQCYSFCHKNCLMNQLSRQPLSQCTTIQCRECKSKVKTVIDFDFNFEVKASWRDFVLLGVCMIVICLATILLTGLREGEGQQRLGKNMSNASYMKQQAQSSSPIAQAVTIVVMFIFAMLFWLTLMGMLFTRETAIRDILHTCVDIKVSAFLQLQNRIRQETLQQIPAKRQISDD